MINLRITYKLMIAFVVLFSFVFPLQMEVKAEGKDNYLIDENNKFSFDDESDETIAEDGTGAAPSQNIMMLLLQIFFYTAVVVVMIYGLVKFLSTRQKKFQRNSLFHVLGGVPVGSQKTLQLVKVGTKVYLIGVGEDISLLKEIDDEHEIESFEKLVLAQQSSPLATSISGMIKKAKETDVQKGEFGSFQQLLRTSLHKQKEKRDSLEQKINSKTTIEKDDSK